MKKKNSPSTPGKFRHDNLKEPTWINGRLVFPVYQKEKDIDCDTYLLLNDIKKNDFEEEQNAIHILEAFLLAHEKGVIPPQWAYDYLAQGFKTFIKSDGRKPLDFFLGFKSGRGPVDSPFKKRYLRQRDFMLYLDMYQLQEWFGFSQYKAATLVSRKLEESKGWNKTRFKFKPPQAEYLRDQYSRYWKKRFESKGYSPIARAIQKAPQRSRQTFLNSFPQA